MSILTLVSVTWRDWTRKSAISCLSNAANAQSTVRKAFWLLIFLALLTLTLVALSVVWRTYFAYPVKTSIRVKRYSRVKFPAISVCNQNRVDCRELGQVSKLCPTKLETCPLSDERAIEAVKTMETEACALDQGSSRNSSDNEVNPINRHTRPEIFTSNHKNGFHPPLYKFPKLPPASYQTCAHLCQQ